MLLISIIFASAESNGKISSVNSTVAFMNLKMIKFIFIHVFLFHKVILHLKFTSKVNWAVFLLGLVPLSESLSYTPALLKMTSACLWVARSQFKNVIRLFLSVISKDYTVNDASGLTYFKAVVSSEWSDDRWVKM